MAENTPKTTKIDTTVPKRRTTSTDKPTDDAPEPQEATTPTEVPESFHEPAVTIEDVQRTFASPEQKLRAELEQWWLDQAHTEINALIPKAIEYGGTERSLDLIAIGRAMVDAGFPVPEFENDQAESEFLSELGIYFYMVGKMGRWGAALRQGNFVADDTIYDLGIYARMVQRIRDAGGWLS